MGVRGGGLVEYTITLKIRRDSCALQRLCIAVAINGTGKGLYFCGGFYLGRLPWEGLRAAHAPLLAH